MFELKPLTEESRALSECSSEFIDAESALCWARLLDATTSDEAGLILLGVYRQQSLVGVAMLFAMRRLKAYRYLWQPLVKLIDRSALLQRLFPELQVGFLEVPMANYSGLLTRPEITTLERSQMIGLVSDYCRQELKWHFLCVKQDTLGADGELDARFSTLDFLPNTRLALTQGDFNAFVEALPSKKRRKLRADQKLLAEHRAVVEVCPDPEAISDELYALYKTTNRKKQEQGDYIPTPVEIGQAFFAQLGQFPCLQAKAIVIRVDGRLIAYCLVMRGGSTLYFKSVGLDYQLSNPSHAYFNLIYAAVEYALQSGCARIDFGMTSYTFKKRIGCSLHSTRYQVAFYHPLLRLLRKLFIHLLERQFDSLEY